MKSIIIGLTILAALSCFGQTEESDWIPYLDTRIPGKSIAYTFPAEIKEALESYNLWIAYWNDYKFVDGRIEIDTSNMKPVLVPHRIGREQKLWEVGGILVPEDRSYTNTAPSNFVQYVLCRGRIRKDRSVQDLYLTRTKKDDEKRKLQIHQDENIVFTKIFPTGELARFFRNAFVLALRGANILKQNDISDFDELAYLNLEGVFMRGILFPVGSNTTGYRGVSMSGKNKYRYQFEIEGKLYRRLVSGKTAEEAAKMRDQAILSTLSELDIQSFGVKAKYLNFMSLKDYIADLPRTADDSSSYVAFSDLEEFRAKDKDPPMVTLMIDKKDNSSLQFKVQAKYKRLYEALSQYKVLDITSDGVPYFDLSMFLDPKKQTSK